MTGSKPVIVHNEKQDKELLDAGWRKTPIEQVLNDALNNDSLKDLPEDQVKQVEDIVESVATVSNMLLRVDKVRRKKDLKMLCEQLDIVYPGDGYSLKQIKKFIKDEAKKVTGALDEQGKKDN